MKVCWGSGGIAPRIFTSTLVRGELSALRPGRFTPNWMHVAQDRDQWRVLVCTVLKHWVP
jgi:hypothetical protein